MIQATVDRCRGWISDDHTWVVTNAVQAAETSRQLPEVPADQILIEPCARNTAPCLGLAAIHLLSQDPDAVMFVMPADHVIESAEQFREAGQLAAALVQQSPEELVLFGVRPTFPATGYGYIERGEEQGTAGVFRVASFREKPDRDRAAEYVASGSCYWNCGIFCWRAATLLNLLEELEPEMHAGLMTLSAAIGTADWSARVADVFPSLRSVSIDHAVLEHAEHVSVIEAPFNWDDVGSWLSLPRLLGQDENGNTIDGPFCGVDTKDCIVRTPENHLVATLGMRDCIVVHTPDATLVANRNDIDSMRELVRRLTEMGLDDWL